MYACVEGEKERKGEREREYSAIDISGFFFKKNPHEYDFDTEKNR